MIIVSTIVSSFNQSWILARSTYLDRKASLEKKRNFYTACWLITCFFRGMCMSNHLLFSCALKYAARLCIFTLSSTMVPYSAFSSFFIFFHLFSSFFQFFSCSIVYLIRFFWLLISSPRSFSRLKFPRICYDFLLVFGSFFPSCREGGTH